MVMVCYGDGIYIITSVKTNPKLQTQVFQPNLLVWKFSQKRTIFTKPWVICSKSYGCCPLIKTPTHQEISQKNLHMHGVS